MERDERTIVTEDSVKRAVYPAQWQRFQRGVVHTPRSFAVSCVTNHAAGHLMFFMVGETSFYTIQFELDECPRTTSVKCNCPDPYRGLCKHICWLVFKVLKHDNLDIFTTHRFPKEHLGILLEEEGARTLLVETWGRSTVPLRPLPLATPASWPLQLPAPTSWPPSNMDCAICFDDMVEQTSARQCKKCSNCFHTACIGKWFAQKRSCPLCRHSV